MPTFVSFLLSSIVGGSVVSALSTLLLEVWKERATAKFDHRLEQQMAGFNHELTKQLTLFETQRNWKEQALVTLYGPLIMQFDRTQRAFQRYRANDLYLEAEVMKRSNEAIRELLLSHGHFLSADLLDAAGLLIEHYDVWLAEYARVRKPDSLDSDTQFVFAGPQGYVFPKAAEQAFRDRFHALQADLYPGL